MSLLLLLPLLLTPIFLAGIVKAMAWANRGMKLSWKNTFGFVFLTMAVGLFFVLLKVLVPATGTLMLVGRLLLVLAIQMAVGGWYLGPRARTKSDEPLKFKRGAVFTFAVVILMVLINIFASALLGAYKDGSPS